MVQLRSRVRRTVTPGGKLRDVVDVHLWTRSLPLQRGDGNAALIAT